MQRDMEKVRGVLLAIEEMDGPFFLDLKPPALGGTDDARETVEYLRLLQSAGFLECSQKNTYRMTWAGHEFLDSVRDPEIWRKTKEGANKVGSWSIKLLGELALGYAKVRAQELGLPLG